MFRFISSLFHPPRDSEQNLRQILIRAATERAIEGTDSRLRALNGYRKKLQGPIERAVEHVVALVDSIPEAVELSAAGFGSDPRIRALFCSVEHLHEVLGKMKDVREYRATHRAADIYALLTVRKEERSVLGIALEGESLRRDVLQTAVNFTSHCCIGLASTEPDTRRELKQRAFDFLVAKALARLVEIKQGKSDIERQRTLLQRKLDAMRAGDWGLEAEISNGGPPFGDISTLEAEINAIEAELGQYRGEDLGLEESLGHIGGVLMDPGSWLDLRPITLTLDHRGIKSDESGEQFRDIEFSELCSKSGERRLVLLVRIPDGEIPDRGNFLSKASYYLN